MRTIPVLLVALLLLTSCADNIVSGTSFPDDARVFRCSQYLGSVNGTFTATSARIDGCQCMQFGDGPLGGDVTITVSEGCKATFKANGEEIEYE